VSLIDQGRQPAVPFAKTRRHHERVGRPIGVPFFRRIESARRDHAGGRVGQGRDIAEQRTVQPIVRWRSLKPSGGGVYALRSRWAWRSSFGGAIAHFHRQSDDASLGYVEVRPFAGDGLRQQAGPVDRSPPSYQFGDKLRPSEVTPSSLRS
jgi:hypothetical protein